MVIKEISGQRTNALALVACCLVCSLVLGCASTGQIDVPTPAVRGNLKLFTDLRVAKAQLQQKIEARDQAKQAVNEAQIAAAYEKSKTLAIESVLTNAQINTNIKANNMDESQAALLNTQKNAAAASQNAEANLAEKQKALEKAEDDVKSAIDDVNEKSEKLTNTEEPAFDQKYLGVVTQCQSILNKYEAESKSQSRTALWIQMVGLVSGAILAPAAIAANPQTLRALIAGASGLAGATNLAESTLKSDGLNGQGALTTRNQIAAQITQDLHNATNSASDLDVRYSALDQAVGDCATYSIAPIGDMPAIPQPGANNTPPPGTPPKS